MSRNSQIKLRRSLVLVFAVVFAVGSFPVVGLTAFFSTQQCSLRTQGYLGGCDNIYARWFDGRRDALNYVLSYSDGYSVTVPGSRSDWSRVGVGCGWGGQIRITGNYPGGLFCTVQYSGNLPHNRPCEQCSGSVQPLSIQNAANGRSYSAPGGIVAAYAIGLSTVTELARSVPLPTQLGNVQVRFGDAEQLCGLFYVSPNQINFQLPEDAPLGLQRVSVTNPSGVRFFGDVFLTEQAPGVFTRNGSGSGAAAADYLPGFVVLYGTGIVPERVGVSDVYLRTGGQGVRAAWIGRAPGFVGLTQINIPLASFQNGQGASLVVGGNESQGFQLIR